MISMKLVIYKPIFILILFFHASFISLPYVNGYGLYKYAIIITVGLFLILHYKTFKGNQFKKINKWMYIYLIMVFLSSFMNRNLEIERKVFWVAIVFCVTVWEGFLLFEYFIIKERTKDLIDALFYLLLFYCILTDLVMIFFPTLHVEKGMYYLTGNKFRVSYLHIQLMILYLQKEKYIRNFLKVKKKDFKFFLLFLVSFCTCIYVECTTGAIGVLLVILFYYSMFWKGKTFKKPIVFLSILFFSTSILILFSGIVKLEPVRYLIEQVFHEDITLTGRLNIYKSLESVFTGHLLYGYGMGSSYEIIMKMIGAPNTQNGVLEIILEQGVIALFLLILLVWQIFKYMEKRESTNYAIIILYIYILFASIEITLDISFILWLALALVFEKNFEFIYESHNQI